MRRVHYVDNSCSVDNIYRVHRVSRLYDGAPRPKMRLALWVLLAVCMALLPAGFLYAQETLPQDKPVELTSLHSQEWVLCAAADCDQPGGESDVYRSLVFTEDHQIYGNAGCNLYYSSYVLDGNEMHFGPIAVTRMYCGEESQAQEDAFLKALERTETYTVDRHTLTFFTDEGVRLLSFEVQINQLLIPTQLYLPVITLEQ